MVRDPQDVPRVEVDALRAVQPRVDRQLAVAAVARRPCASYRAHRPLAPVERRVPVLHGAVPVHGKRHHPDLVVQRVTK